MNHELWEFPRPKFLSSFQEIVSLVKALRRSRESVEEAVRELQAEYARAFPTLRLVLYLKDGVYLYWGHFMAWSSFDLVSLGPGFKHRSWIRQLGTVLTRDMIMRYGESARSRELYEFDRRAGALRRARKRLTSAEQSIRMTLLHLDRKRAEHVPLPILPEEAQSEIPNDFRKHLGYAWRLSRDAEGIERRMADLAERYKSRKVSRVLALRMVKSYSLLPDAARWFLRGRLLNDATERLSHRFLWGLLRLARESRGVILDFDRMRRHLLKVGERHARACSQLRSVGTTAIRSAEALLLESQAAHSAPATEPAAP